MLQLGLPVAAVTLLLDQLGKWWVRAMLLDPPREVELAPFLKLVAAWNRGISFSLFPSDSPAHPWGLFGIAAVVCLVFVIGLMHSTRRWQALGLGLVIGGAIGNMIDRLRFGAIFDFLYLRFPNSASIINPADAAIACGGAILLVDGAVWFARQIRRTSG